MPDQSTRLTLKKIAKVPSELIKKPTIPGNFYRFSSLSFIKGCYCSNEFAPRAGSIRSKLMIAVREFCEKQYYSCIDNSWCWMVF